MTKFELRKKVNKNNLRITAKRHAHLQTLTETPTKFQNNSAKTVGGVAFTRFCDRQSDGGQTSAQGKDNMSSDPDVGDIINDFS